MTIGETDVLQRIRNQQAIPIKVMKDSDSKCRRAVFKRWWKGDEKLDN